MRLVADYAQIYARHVGPVRQVPVPDVLGYTTTQDGLTAYVTVELERHDGTMFPQWARIPAGNVRVAA